MLTDAFHNMIVYNHISCLVANLNSKVKSIINSILGVRVQLKQRRINSVLLILHSTRSLRWTLASKGYFYVAFHIVN